MQQLPPLFTHLPCCLQIAEEGAVTTASFAERVLPKVTLSHDMEPGSGAIVQKGVHKVRRGSRCSSARKWWAQRAGWGGAASGKGLPSVSWLIGVCGLSAGTPCSPGQPC